MSKCWFKWLKYDKYIKVFSRKGLERSSLSIDISRYYKKLAEKSQCCPQGGGLHLNKHNRITKVTCLLTIKVYETHPSRSSKSISESSLGNNIFLGEKMSVVEMLSSSPRYLWWWRPKHKWADKSTVKLWNKDYLACALQKKQHKLRKLKLLSPPDRTGESRRKKQKCTEENQARTNKIWRAWNYTTTFYFRNSSEDQIEVENSINFWGWTWPAQNRKAGRALDEKYRKDGHLRQTCEKRHFHTLKMRTFSGERHYFS